MNHWKVNSFLEQASAGRNQWWRWAVCLFLLLIGYGVGQIALLVYLFQRKSDLGLSQEQFDAALANSDIQAFEPNLNLFLAIVMSGFVLAGILFFVGFRFIHQRPVLSVLTSRDHFDWQRFATGFGLWFSFGCLFTFAFLPRSEYDVTFNWGTFIPLSIIAVLLIPIQASVEEVIFRGYLLQGFYLVTKNRWISLSLVTILFVLLHGANPEVAAAGFWPMMGIYFSFAAALGLVALMDDGLETPCGIHAANNLITVLVLSTSNGALSTDAIFQTNVESLAKILPFVIPLVSLATLSILFFIYQFGDTKTERGNSDST